MCLFRPSCMIGTQMNLQKVIADVNDFCNLSQWLNKASRLDTLKDFFNNEIGRQIADYAHRNGLSPADIESLVNEAWKSGELMIDPQSDPRIRFPDADGMPYPPPEWKGPPHGWSPGAGGEGGGGEGGGEGGGGWPRWFDPFGWFNPPPSPLVFDLDGDGVELVSLADSRAFFDLDVNGFGERTAWVKGDDGGRRFHHRLRRRRHAERRGRERHAHRRRGVGPAARRSGGRYPDRRAVRERQVRP